jgi:hypothetical protein
MCGEREIWLRGRGRGRERLEMVVGNGKRRRENFLAFTAFSHFLSHQEKIIKQEITEKTRVENRVDHQFSNNSEKRLQIAINKALFAK